jgi:hypothetical protein
LPSTAWLTTIVVKPARTTCDTTRTATASTAPITEVQKSDRNASAAWVSVKPGRNNDWSTLLTINHDATNARTLGTPITTSAAPSNSLG